MRASIRKVVLLIFTTLLIPGAGAWELSDFVHGVWDWSDIAGDDVSTFNQATLSMEEVSALRVRDIKRRLSRNHGYSAEEVAVMLDKKDLIHALAFEEEKIRLKQEDEVKRILLQRGILTAIVAVFIIICWPLLHRAYEVISINTVVYIDRKRLEAQRCWELKSYEGMLGCGVMSILDVLQFWLTASLLLSWVMRSKYFFPTPQLAIKPAQMMGGEIARSSVGNYGLNIAPMILSWGMRFAYRRAEAWTGRTLARALNRQRQAARENESEEERAARKARKQAKREAKYRQTAMQSPQADMPPDWMQPDGASDSGTTFTPATGNIAQSFSNLQFGQANGRADEDIPAVPNSKNHEDFLEQIDHHNSEFDDLD